MNDATNPIVKSKLAAGRRQTVTHASMFAQTMKHHAITAVLALAPPSVTTAGEVRFECAIGEHAIEVHLADRAFRPEDHKIEYRKGGYGDRTLHIDGEEPVGSDNLLPNREWKRFSVSWDGEEIPVAPELYRNFFDPNLNTELEPQLAEAPLRFVVDPKCRWIQIWMLGSDGAGSYSVAWHLARDGKHKLISPSDLRTARLTQ